MKTVAGTPKYHYAVRERHETVYEEESTPWPKNCRVVGHIVDDNSVHRNEKTSEAPEIYSCGTFAFANSFAEDIYRNSLSIYPVRDKVETIKVAMLKIIKLRIKCNRHSTKYSRPLVYILYPVCAMRKTASRSFIKELDKNQSKEGSSMRKGSHPYKVHTI